MVKDLSTFILAGGKSSRMGEDKAFIHFSGSTLLMRQLTVARELTRDVRIVGPSNKFSAFGLVVEDIYCDAGPLGAIHAALNASHEEWNLILSVDTPFLQLAFLRYLVTQAQGCEAVVTVPRCVGLQPLCAVYRPSFKVAAEEALELGRFRIDDLFSNASTRIIEYDEIEANGFSVEMFENLNTPAQLERAVLRGA